MSSTLKVCPICQTSHAPSALVCRMCGASLAKVEAVARVAKRVSANQDETTYDFRHGENDLVEQPLSRRGQTCFTVAITALVAFLMGGIFVAMSPSLLNRETIQQPVGGTNTPEPTAVFATVTLGPPTATQSQTPLPTLTPSETPLPPPCIQVITAGDNLYNAISRCGYREFDVILPTVMALNGMTDAASLQINQEIVVPWPTATIDPNAVPTEVTSAALSSTESSQTDLMALDESIDAFAPTAVPTLPAGLMWHRIQPNENLASVTNLYGVNMKILSEINPEMDFAQCDFGNAYGGPNCNVMVSVGQEIRVPAPSPTPTLPPTHDPNSTATPTATPTYNKPFATSPADRQFFGRHELVTLRWAASGTLSIEELYRVDVEDITTGQIYTAYTRDLFLEMHAEWQGTQKPRHDFSWTVGIVNTSDRSRLRYTTAPHTFVWQGLVNDESETQPK